MARAIGERFLTQGSLFIISLILARILSPEDYGLLSLLLVFINLADVLVTNGLAKAINTTTRAIAGRLWDGLRLWVGAFTLPVCDSVLGLGCNLCILWYGEYESLPESSCS